MPNNDEILNVNIINALGLQALPDEQKMKLVEKMVSAIQKRVALRVLETLNEQEKDEFEKILEENNEMKITNFLQSKVPNIEEVVNEEIVSLKKQVMDRGKKLDQELEK